MDTQSPAPATLRIGPAGWSYDDWKGIVYPPKMPRSLHPLTFLCDFFDTVEINASFYRPPDPRHAASWVEKVSTNPRFKFTAKLWERFTHQRDTPFEARQVHQFCEGIRPLHEAGKLGALLIQFPWSFRRNDANRRWLGQVTAAFSQYPLALEVRHASWDQPQVYAGLKERNVAFCNIDQPLFNDSIAASATVTAPLGYVRFHGRNRTDWFREDAGRDERYNYLYTEEELRPWIEKINAIRNKTKEIYAITNNHYRGQAVVNAFELQAQLGGPVPAIPGHLVDEYPRLKTLRPA